MGTPATLILALRQSWSAAVKPLPNPLLGQGEGIGKTAQSEKLSRYFIAIDATIAPAEIAITVQNRKMPRDAVGGFADAGRIAASAIG